LRDGWSVMLDVGATVGDSRVNVADGSADEVLAGVVGGALGVGVD